MKKLLLLSLLLSSCSPCVSPPGYDIVVKQASEPPAFNASSLTSIANETRDDESKEQLRRITRDMEVEARKGKFSYTFGEGGCTEFIKKYFTKLDFKVEDDDKTIDYNVTGAYFTKLHQVTCKISWDKK